jgi:hypothetical protein
MRFKKSWRDYQYYGLTTKKEWAFTISMVYVVIMIAIGLHLE